MPNKMIKPQRSVSDIKIEELEAKITDFQEKIAVFEKVPVVHSTNIATKAKYWPVFAKLIEGEWKFGGEKYKFPTVNKEATDWVCELGPGATGCDWIFLTCAKYLGRIINLKREKDLLKIANYMFIAWLKMGFHLNEEHDQDVGVSK